MSWPDPIGPLTSLDYQYAVAADAVARYQRGQGLSFQDAGELAEVRETQRRARATHQLRVRHHQAARAQAHVRTAVGW